MFEKLLSPISRRDDGKVIRSSLSSYQNATFSTRFTPSGIMSSLRRNRLRNKVVPSCVNTNPSCTLRYGLCLSIVMICNFGQQRKCQLFRYCTPFPIYTLRRFGKWENSSSSIYSIVSGKIRCCNVCGHLYAPSSTEVMV